MLARALSTRRVPGAQACRSRWSRGIAVILITHNPHHAYPIGDRFTILKRGRTLGTFAKGDLAREDMIQMMSGSEELEKLEHELQMAREQASLANSET